jgi:hypothetical protein
MAAMYIGLRAMGTLKPTIVIPPEKRADAPAPATARPTISMTEFLAAAHMIDPSSNRQRAKRYVHFTSKNV